MRDQPALHRRIRRRPPAPDQVPAPNRIREPDQEGRRTDPGDLLPGPAERQPAHQRYRRVPAGRRIDAHSLRPAQSQGVLQKRTQPQGQSRRDRGHGRRHARLDHQGRQQGHPAARRHAAVAGRQDLRRRFHPHHQRQHHHPDQPQPGLFHRRGQPDRGRHRDLTRANGRSPKRTRCSGKFTLLDIKPRPARRSAHRGHVQHQHQRHPERLGHGSVQQEQKGDPDHPVGPAEQGRGGKIPRGSEKTVGTRPEKTRDDPQEEQGHQPDLLAQPAEPGQRPARAKSRARSPP